MSDRCPTCRRPLTGQTDIRLDMTNNVVIANGRFATLTDKEALLLEALLDKRPNVASKEFIYGRMYDSDVVEPKVIDVFVCKLRAKVERLGLSINTSWGRGYYLADKVTA